MIYIHGMGHFHPENVIDNKFLEDLGIESSHQWIMERVGIRTRRTVLPLDYIRETKNKDIREALKVAELSNPETGKRAAEMAIKNAGISADQIGMVIAGGCSPDTVTPAESARIANRLGIQAKCVDINVACSSFGAQINLLSMMTPDALGDYVLLVSAENNTKVVDYSDRSTAVLWGDGTSAAVVSTCIESKAKVIYSSLASNPEGCDKILIPRTGHFVQEGNAVQLFAVKTTMQCFEEAKTHFNDSDNDVYFVGHQANLVMLQSVCKRCEVPDDRHLFNVDEYGNTGAAGAPIVLSQNWEKFKANDKVILVVVGAGFTWSGMVIEFH